MSRSLSCTLVTVLLLTAFPAASGVLDVEPQVIFTARYNDNPELLADASNPQSSASSVADFRLRITQNSADTKLQFTPHIRRIDYTEKKYDALSLTEYFLNGEISKQFEALRMGSAFRFANQGILTAEDPDPDDADNSGNANFSQAEDRVERIIFSPYVTWNLSELDLVSINGQATRSDEIKRLSPRADFNSSYLGINYRRAIAKRHSIGLEASGSSTDTVQRREFCTFFGVATIPESCRGRLDVLGNRSELYLVTQTTEQDFNTFAAKFTYEYQPFEDLTVTANYGIQKTALTQKISEFRPLEGIRQSLSLNTRFDNSTYLLGLDYAQQRANWHLELLREVQPSSVGEPIDKKQIQGWLDYQLARLWRFRAIALYYQQTERSVSTSSKNNFLRTDVTLTRTLDRNSSIGVTYIYRNRDPRIETTNPISTTDLNLKRTSNSVTMTYRYNFR